MRKKYSNDSCPILKNKFLKIYFKEDEICCKYLEELNQEPLGLYGF